MTSITDLDEAMQNDILQRLKRIEGQSRGIQRMVEEGRECQEVMNQLMAMRAATNALSIKLLEEFAVHCLHSAADAPSLEKAVAQMVGVISKLAR